MRGIAVQKLAFGICLIAVFALQAAQTFQDSTFVNIGLKWDIPIWPNAVTSTSNGKFSVTNPTNYILPYFTDSSFNPTSFTFNATMKSIIKSSFSGFSLFMSNCQNSNCSNGYAIVVDSAKKCTFWRDFSSPPAQQKLIASFPVSQLTGNDNFTISKKDSTWKISINNILAKTITENSYTTGKIGMIAGPHSQLEFDDILLTNSYTAPTERRFFADSFENTSNISNWYFDHAEEPSTIQNNTLSIVNGTDYTQLALVTGSFDSSYLKAILSAPVAADSMESYGIGFFRKDNQGNASILRSFALLINRKGLVGFAQPHTDSFSLSSMYGNITHAKNGGNDTLEMICDKPNNQFKFKINGQDLGTTAKIPAYHFEGAGIFVSSPDAGNSPMVVNVHKFIVAPDSSPQWLAAGPVVRFLDKRSMQKATYANSQFVYNIRGQRIHKMHTPVRGIFIIPNKNTAASKALKIQ